MEKLEKLIQIRRKIAFLVFSTEVGAIEFLNKIQINEPDFRQVLKIIKKLREDEKYKETLKEIDKLLNEYKQIKEQIIEENKSLINKAVEKYAKSEYLRDDIYSSALKGFSEAIDRFDYNKGSFIQYAKKYIKGNILEDIKKLNDNKLISLETPINIEDKENEEITLGDIIEDKSSNTCEKAMKELLKEEIDQILKSNILDERKRYVISSYFGIYNDKKTLKEIGKELGGISKQRVGKIKKRALNKLIKNPKIRNKLAKFRNSLFT